MAKRNNDILGDIEQVQASVPVPEAQEATPERRELQEWVRTTEKYAQCLKELKAVRQAIDEEIAEIRTVLAREQQLSEELKKGTPDFQAFSDFNHGALAPTYLVDYNPFRQIRQVSPRN